MKIKPEHYQHIKVKIATIADKLPSHREVLKSDPRVKDIEKRLRWDAAYGAGLTRFLCDEVYPYADDDHIDTALRRVMAELRV